MFAGLPGLGVGTLFYVVIAIWMPLRELDHVLRGTSSLARWRLILRQLFNAGGIVLTVMAAERALMWALGAGGPQPFSPARVLHGELDSWSPGSLIAAPIAASLIMLAGVMLFVEILRVVVAWRGRLTERKRSASGFVNALDSTTGQ